MEWLQWHEELLEAQFSWLVALFILDEYYGWDIVSKTTVWKYGLFGKTTELVSRNSRWSP